MGTEERRQKEKMIKRDDIVEAAERVFFSKGYEASSMDEVAKEAQYSKRTVYVYFNSKEQIYYEIMIRGYRIFLATIEAGLRESNPGNAVEELRCIYLLFIRFKNQHPDYYKAIMEYETKEPDAQAGIESQAREECYRLGERLFGYLNSALQKGTEEGTFLPGLNVERTALILWACTLGVFITGEKKEQYLMEFHQIDRKTFEESAFEMILNSIRYDGRNS